MDRQLAPSLLSLNNKRGFTPLERHVIYDGDDMRNISHPFKNDGVKISPFLTGFTLVEVVVSMVILATVVGGFMASFVATQRFISRSYRRLQATNYTRQVLENLRNSVRADHWVDPNNADPLDLTPAGAPRPCGINMGDFAATFGANCTYEVQSVLNDARQVSINISWTEP